MWMWSIMIAALEMQNRKSFISLGQRFHGEIISFHYCTGQLCSFFCPLFWVFATTAILNWYFFFGDIATNGKWKCPLSDFSLAKAGMIVQFSQILYLSHPTIWKLSHYCYKDWDAWKIFLFHQVKGGVVEEKVPHKKCYRKKRRKEKSKQL